MPQRISIAIEFERPGDHSLAECAELVLHQMRATPTWDERSGTGLLNYVCHDKTMEVVAAEVKDRP